MQQRTVELVYTLNILMNIRNMRSYQQALTVSTFKTEIKAVIQAINTIRPVPTITV